VAQADQTDTSDDIFPGSFAVQGHMGTVPYRLSPLSPEQLGHGIRKVRSLHPCKFKSSPTDDRADE